MAETKEEEIIDASGVENEAPDVQASGENEPVKEIQDTVGLQEDKKMNQMKMFRRIDRPENDSK